MLLAMRLAPQGWRSGREAPLVCFDVRGASWGGGVWVYPEGGGGDAITGFFGAPGGVDILTGRQPISEKHFFCIKMHVFQSNIQIA